MLTISDVEIYGILRDLWERKIQKTIFMDKYKTNISDSSDIPFSLPVLREKMRPLGQTEEKMKKKNKKKYNHRFPIGITAKKIHSSTL